MCISNMNIWICTQLALSSSLLSSWILSSSYVQIHIYNTHICRYMCVEYVHRHICVYYKCISYVYVYHICISAYVPNLLCHRHYLVRGSCQIHPYDASQMFRYTYIIYTYIHMCILYMYICTCVYYIYIYVNLTYEYLIYEYMNMYPIGFVTFEFVDLVKLICSDIHI